MKKLLSLVLSLCMLFNSNVLAVTNKNDIVVYIDEREIIFDVKPQLIGGRTMVPLRAIFEGLGAIVEWEEQTQTITAYNEFNIVKTTINSNIINVNGQSKTMDIAPMIVDNITLIPARFIAEAFGCKVEWKSDEMAIYIKTMPVDYSKVEQDAIDENDIEVDEENNVLYSDFEYYDCEVPFPTYDSVTGSEYIMKHLKTHMYECTDIKDFEIYVDCLEEEGWDIYDTKTNRENYSFALYMRKGLQVIFVIMQLKYDEVWIIY